MRVTAWASGWLICNKRKRSTILETQKIIRTTAPILYAMVSSMTLRSLQCGDMFSRFSSCKSDQVRKESPIRSILPLWKVGISIALGDLLRERSSVLSRLHSATLRWDITCGFYYLHKRYLSRDSFDFSRANNSEAHGGAKSITMLPCRYGIRPIQYWVHWASTYHHRDNRSEQT